MILVAVPFTVKVRMLQAEVMWCRALGVCHVHPGQGQQLR